MAKGPQAHFGKHGLLHPGSSLFGIFFGILVGHVWVRRDLEMILSHVAPSCLNMSSYRAIWTHVRPNLIFYPELSGQQI